MTDHDETNHANHTAQQERAVNEAINAVNEAASLVTYIEDKAKAAQERLEAAQERGALAARELFHQLEKLPGGVYYAADGNTYHAETKGIRHPDGTMTVEKTITARNEANATVLGINTERGALLEREGTFEPTDFFRDHVLGHYTDSEPEPAKGEPTQGDLAAARHYLDPTLAPARTNDLKKTLQQERQDGEALASAYRARYRTPEDVSSYASTPRQGILVGGIIEAGPALRPQPRWPKNTEPDYIMDIHGGFVDGYGRAHEAPARFDLDGPAPYNPAHYNAIRKIAGQWRWYALDPREP